ncbi:MAG: DUF4398 domain-containing protein [Nitrospiraceae bacterium]|nr:MAG: DUF4398 domain-containing protein [Nitrospiraceae bacterium]
MKLDFQKYRDIFVNINNPKFHRKEINMRNRWGSTLKILLLLFCCAFLLGSCATKGVPPVKEIATVERSINMARESNAEIYAPLELRYAEDKLQQAKAAMQMEEYTKAGRLTDEAAIDARLAETKALTEKEKKSVKETKDNIDILRNEIERAKKYK